MFCLYDSYYQVCVTIELCPLFGVVANDSCCRMVPLISIQHTIPVMCLELGNEANVTAIHPILSFVDKN